MNVYAYRQRYVNNSVRKVGLPEAASQKQLMRHSQGCSDPF